MCYCPLVRCVSMNWAPRVCPASASCDLLLRFWNPISLEDFRLFVLDVYNERRASEMLSARLHHIQDPITVTWIQTRSQWPKMSQFTHTHIQCSIKHIITALKHTNTCTLPFQHEITSHNPQGDCTVLLLWRLVTPARYGLIFRYSERKEESSMGGGRWQCWWDRGWKMEMKWKMEAFNNEGLKSAVVAPLLTCGTVLHSALWHAVWWGHSGFLCLANTASIAQLVNAQPPHHRGGREACSDLPAASCCPLLAAVRHGSRKQESHSCHSL